MFTLTVWLPAQIEIFWKNIRYHHLIGISNELSKWFITKHYAYTLSKILYITDKKYLESSPTIPSNDIQMPKLLFNSVCITWQYVSGSLSDVFTAVQYPQELCPYKVIAHRTIYVKSYHWVISGTTMPFTQLLKE